MTKVRFRPAFRFPGAAFLCFVFLAAAAYALPASAQGIPLDGATSSPRLEQSGALATRHDAPADDDGTIDTGDRGLLDTEAWFPADCSDGFDDVSATAFSQAGGTDFIRSLSLIEDTRIRAIWLSHRSPVAWIDDGSPRIYARPPPVLS